MSYEASRQNEGVNVPWRTATVYCLFCAHDWVAMFFYDTKLLECPCCQREVAVRNAGTA